VKIAKVLFMVLMLAGMAVAAFGFTYYTQTGSGINASGQYSYAYETENITLGGHPDFDWHWRIFGLTAPQQSGAAPLNCAAYQDTTGVVFTRVCASNVWTGSIWSSSVYFQYSTGNASQGPWVTVGSAAIGSITSSTPVWLRFYRSHDNCFNGCTGATFGALYSLDGTNYTWFGTHYYSSGVSNNVTMGFKMSSGLNALGTASIDSWSVAHEVLPTLTVYNNGEPTPGTWTGH
jgi:hypothetical protein